jgi:multisite-specific tRNA:(cytosine-C5)-methyltransferase
VRRARLQGPSPPPTRAHIWQLTPCIQTAQLLEALHALDPTGGAPPPGLLIANDSDTKRAHLLIHQSARLPSPAFAVTNLDASHFPALTLPPFTGPDGTPDLGAKRAPLLFDRILCDVPCAGDGTLRKNAGIWAKWTPQDGAGLHALQLRILLRALRLLRPGGRLVYSTCSLNPAEDEAVVAGALREVGAGAALVDVADRLPGLVRRPGMRKWTPSSADKGKEVHCVEGEAFEAYRARVGASARLARSHFPPTAEEAEQMQLERW